MYIDPKLNSSFGGLEPDHVSNNFQPPTAADANPNPATPSRTTPLAAASADTATAANYKAAPAIPESSEPDRNSMYMRQQLGGFKTQENNSMMTTNTTQQFTSSSVQSQSTVTNTSRSTASDSCSTASAAASNQFQQQHMQQQQPRQPASILKNVIPVAASPQAAAQTPQAAAPVAAPAAAPSKEVGPGQTMVTPNRGKGVLTQQMPGMRVPICGACQGQIRSGTH